jgi:seryl-tRNA synthetase
MLDPYRLRNNLNEVSEALSKRGYQLDTSELDRLESQRKSLQVATQDLQAERNKLSKEIGQAKKQGTDAQPLLDQVASIGDSLKQHEADLSVLQDHLHEILSRIPNIPHQSVPPGDSENDNLDERPASPVTPRANPVHARYSYT